MKNFIFLLICFFSVSFILWSKESLTIYPQNILINQGTMIKFTIVHENNNGFMETPNLRKIIWKVSGGTFNKGNLTFVAGNKGGNYSISAKYLNLLSKTKIKIINNVILKDIIVTPSNISLKCGNKCSFNVIGIRSDNSKISLTPIWKSNGGKISNNGLYESGNIPGNYFVTAQVGKIIKKVNVKLIATNDKTLHKAGNSKITILKWNISGNFFAPHVKTICKINDKSIKVVRIYTINNKGISKEIGASGVARGMVQFNKKINKFDTKYITIKGFNSQNKLITQIRKNAK